MRNMGFVQEVGTVANVPEKEALPCALRATDVVSTTVGELPLALQTSAPTTFVTGPVVPLALPPLRTSPSTLYVTAPVLRSTKAKPPAVVHGDFPLSIPPTIFDTDGAVITPLMLFQNTTLLLALVLPLL
jgi:hypothetical protein